MPAILGLPLNFRANQRWIVFRLAEMEDPYKAVASQGVTTLIAACPEKVCISNDFEMFLELYSNERIYRGD